MLTYPKMLALLLLVACLFTADAVLAQISGHLVVCRGASRTTLTGTPTGGTWASGDATRATVNSTTGEVTGVAAGTATISYTDPSSTVHTAVVTVNGYVMGNIGFSMGSDIRCTGGVPATCTVSPLIGNNWTSSDPSIATINTGGSVVPSATNAGTVTISYRHGYGNCYVTRSMTVNPTPTVSMTNPVCAGVTQTATGTPSGGTWMSSNASVGTINTTTGVLSAFIGGGTYIRYTVGSCYSQPFLTVSAGVAAFGGSATVCVGNSSTLTCATGGGTWSSSDPSVATIGSSTGVVTGASLGTSTISYVVGSSCFRTAVVTVNAGPSASAGPDEVCVGQTIAITNATGGGTWSSSNTARATVTTYGGTVTGVGAGTVNISYRVGGGCASVKTITVNAAMASIAGGPNVCEGSSVTLTHAMGAGTWTASNSHATVDLMSGVMTGLTAGSVNITYTASPGCKKGQMMIVKSSPAAITGELTVCPGTTTALSSASGGGTWSSSNTSVATVNSYGVVSGVSGGTATITYTVASWGCSATAVVTVSSTGGSISGSTSLCLGSSTTLSSSAGGGTWSSSNPAVATIGSSSGVVTSVGTGTTVISYITGSSCNSAVVVTVSDAPSAISGATGICSGSTTPLSNSISGGSWSSGNTSVATVISSTGVVSGIAAGTATITYAIGSCSVTTVVTVTAAPSAITGTLSLCEGSSTTLSNTAGGGIWSSGDPSVATISASTGVATGVAAGTAAITYTIGTCSVTTVITVNAGSADISGSTTLYPSLTTILSASVPGGTWSSSNVSIATVGSSTGIVTAVAAGSATITYSLGSCLSVTTIVTVLSDPAPITGGLGLEVGDGDTLANPVEGGLWSSSNTSVATIGSVSGILTAVGVGTTTISYTVGAAYTATIIVTVSSTIAPTGCPRSWASISSNTELTPRWDANGIDMTLDECGVPYVALSYYSTSSYAPFQNHLRVLKLVNGRFEQIGPIMDSTSTEYISVAAAPDGTTYVAYSDYSDAFKLVVKKYNGTDWVNVGAMPLTTGGATLGSMRIDHSGVPYIGYGDWTSGEPNVKMFNGTTWEPVGSTGFAPTGAGLTGMELDDSGHVYVSYETGTSVAFVNRIGVMKYNGSTWVGLGDTAATYENLGWERHFAVSGNGTPYVSWFDGWGTSVAGFDGTTWNNLGMPVGVPYADIFTGNDGSVMLSYSGYYSTATIRYDGSNWVPFGSAATDISGDSRIRAVMSPSGEQYTAVLPYSVDRAFVLRLDGSQAQYIPGNQGTYGSGNPPWEGSIPPHAELAFGADGTKYVADVENGKLSMRRFYDGYWVPLDTNDPTASAVISSDNIYGYFDVANDSSGNIYAAIPTSTPGYGMFIKKFDGASWSVVGAEIPEFPNLYGASIDVEISSSGLPYVAFPYGSYPDQVSVWKFDGSTWSGSSITAEVAQLSLAIDGNDTAYVFYTDWLSSRAGYVKKYDGSSWVAVGSGSCAPAYSNYTDIAIAPDGTPYIIYTDGANGNKATIKKFMSGSWAAVGGGVVSPGACAYTSIAFSSTGEPVISFVDSTNNNQVVVKEFDGSSWLEVGGATISGQDFTSARVVLDADDVPYVSGKHSSTFMETVVMKYAAGNEVEGNLTVCAGQTTTLHAFGNGSWTSSNPSVAAVSCIGIVRGIAAGTAAITYSNDTCETVLVVTVNASPSAGTITGASVIPYGGSTTLSASVSGGVWSCTPSSVATVNSSGVVSAVSDGPAFIRYTVTSGGCSAYASHAVTVVWMKPGRGNSDDTPPAFSVYPNPTSGAFTLQSGVAGKLTVLSIDGRVVMESKVDAGNTALSMPHGSAAGVYVLRFAGDDGTVKTSKLIFND